MLIGIISVVVIAIVILIVFVIAYQKETPRVGDFRIIEKMKEDGTPFYVAEEYITNGRFRCWTQRTVEGKNDTIEETQKEIAKLIEVRKRRKHHVVIGTVSGRESIECKNRGLSYQK